MEGSAGGKPVDRGDPRVILEHAGLPHRGVALWLNAKPQFRDKFKRDAAAGTRFWRGGHESSWPSCRRSRCARVEQQLAADIILLQCRDARERFLAAHAESVYRKLTNRLENFLRVDELVDEAAKLVPGLTPTQRQVNAESASDAIAKKTASRSIRASSWRKCWRCPKRGMHLCHAMLRPKMEVDRAHARSSSTTASSTSAPREVERQGKAAVVTIKNPRFLNAEDDDTLDDTETAADIAILDPLSEICVLRGGVVEHPKYARPQDLLRRHQSHASLSRQDPLSLVHPPRHGRGEQDAARPGDGRRAAPTKSTAARARSPGSRSSTSSPSAAAASICWRWTTWWPAATPI